MSLIHLENQVVFERELAEKSWSTYISYDLDDATQEIVAETISVFHDRASPQRSSLKRRGRLRIPIDQAPSGLVHQIEQLCEPFDQARETTTMRPRETTVLKQPV